VAQRLIVVLRKVKGGEINDTPPPDAAAKIESAYTRAPTVVCLSIWPGYFSAKRLEGDSRSNRSSPATRALWAYAFANSTSSTEGGSCGGGGTTFAMLLNGRPGVGTGSGIGGIAETMGSWSIVSLKFARQGGVVNTAR
jgi:hypothetical protein